MTDCTDIQARLAEEGVEAATRDEIKRHLTDCVDCTEVLDDLRRLEAAFDELPAHDASDALVAKTLAAVRRDGAAPKAWPWQRGLAASLAASVVIAAAVGITLRFDHPQDQYAMSDLRQNKYGYAAPSTNRKLSLQTVAEQEPSSSLSKSESQAQPAPQAESFEMTELAQKKAPEDAYRSELNEEIGREIDVIAELESRSRQELVGEKAKADNRLDEVDAPANEINSRGDMPSPVKSGERQRLLGGARSNMPKELESLDRESVVSEDSFADDKSLSAQLRDETRAAGQAGAHHRRGR